MLYENGLNHLRGAKLIEGDGLTYFTQRISFCLNGTASLVFVVLEILGGLRLNLFARLRRRKDFSPAVFRIVIGCPHRHEQMWWLSNGSAENCISSN